MSNFTEFTLAFFGGFMHIKVSLEIANVFSRVEWSRRTVTWNSARTPISLLMSLSLYICGMVEEHTDTDTDTVAG